MGEAANYFSTVERIRYEKWGENVKVIMATSNLMESDHLGKQKKYNNINTVPLLSYSQIKAFNHLQANE